MALRRLPNALRKPQ